MPATPLSYLAAGGVSRAGAETQQAAPCILYVNKLVPKEQQVFSCFPSRCEIAFQHSCAILKLWTTQYVARRERRSAYATKHALLVRHRRRPGGIETSQGAAAYSTVDRTEMLRGLAMTSTQKQAIWELCRQGLHDAADQAEQSWLDGERFKAEGRLPLTRALASLVDRANWDASARSAPKRDARRSNPRDQALLTAA